jgi:hypothetical protein
MKNAIMYIEKQSDIHSMIDNMILKRNEEERWMANTILP